MKPLPANPGLEASLGEGDPPQKLENSRRRPTRQQPNLDLSISLLSIVCKPPVSDGPEPIKVDKETVDTEFCCGLAKILATVILPEKLAS